MSCHVRIADGVSALTSFVGLCVTLGYVQDTNIALWDSSMIFTADPDIRAATDDLAETFVSACAASSLRPIESGPYKIFLQQQEWGNNNYSGISLGMDNGHSYKPWVMLQWILLCSVFFQGGRFWAFAELEDADENELFQYVPSRGPDFWRWVEYALTSPLQIIIIAGSFYLRETMLISLMAALQGALVVSGYAIEMEIQALYAEKIALRQSQAPRKTFQSKNVLLIQMKLIFLLLCAYLCHIIIWTILITKFRLSEQALIDCQNPSVMPPEIIIIIVLECALFSLFGVVLTVQALKAMFIAQITPEYTHVQWANVSAWYTVLSLSAKLILEWGFISMLAAAEDRGGMDIYSNNITDALNTVGM